MLRASVLILAGCLLLPGRSPFAGIWEGTANDLPAVELHVEDHNGAISGTMTFYFQTRDNEKSPWRVMDKFTVPLLSPKVAGSVLTFETIHHKTHGSPELGPNNRYRVDFVSAKELRLHILRGNAGQDARDPGLKLTLRN